MSKSYKLMIYSGWVAFALFIVSVYYIVIGKSVKLHRDFAIAAFVFVFIHIVMTLYPKFKRR